MLDAIVTLELRGTDEWGSGTFGAPRCEHRKHTGVDFAAEPGALLLSPVQGVVTKWKQVYRDTERYHYVQVTDMEGRQHRFYYIEPILEVGNSVEPGDTLGVVQNMELRYPGITNHVHYEIKVGKKEYSNPLADPWD